MSPNLPARSQRPHLDGLGREGLFEAQALPSFPGAVREVSSLSQDNRTTGSSSCSYSELRSAPRSSPSPCFSPLGVAGWEQASPVA